MGFAEFLATADGAAQRILGGLVTYTPSFGTGVDVTGIFTAHHFVQPVLEGGVVSVAPAVFFRLADLPSDPEENLPQLPTITKDGVEYAVREVQKDGEGGVLLLLRRKA